MKLTFYVIVYGFLGFWLERVINLIFMQRWYDNSVLYGPFQLMYGFGVVWSVVAYHTLKKLRLNRYLFWPLFLFLSIFGVGLSEYISGVMHEAIYGIVFWDYSKVFTVCHHPYVCILPTSIFGLLTVLTVILVHPFLERIILRIPKVVIGFSLVGMLINIVVTYLGVLL